MKVIDCVQGTEKWLQARAGIPTASNFSKIITPTGKPSKSAESYMHSLIAERLLGHPLTEYVSFYMERGSQMEAEAVSCYEFLKDVETEAVGFVTNDAGTIGASPDRFVGDDGALEIKCPAPWTHVGYLLAKPVDKKYYPQLQGQLWVTERDWVDNESYCPGLPEALVRVDRDEEYISKLSATVTAFSEVLESTLAELKERIGWTEPTPDEPSAIETVRSALIEMNN